MQNARRRFCQVRDQVKRIDRRLGLPRLRFKARARIHLASAHVTRLCDRLEERLPSRLARGFHRVRVRGPGTLAAFTATKFKEDAAFLGTFAVAAPVTWHGLAVGAIAAGMNPALAIGGHELIEIPVNLGVIVYRQHRLAQKDGLQSFGQTLKQLGKQYVEAGEQRLERNRTFLRRYTLLK